MINKARRIKVDNEQYEIPLSVFELIPPIDEVQYLTGAFYNKIDYPMVALYPSDEYGNIVNNKPYIHEEGIHTFADVFKLLDYVLLDD